jgi:hypothetical protein
MAVPLYITWCWCLGTPLTTLRPYWCLYSPLLPCAAPAPASPLVPLLLPVLQPEVAIPVGDSSDTVEHPVTLMRKVNASHVGKLVRVRVRGGRATCWVLCRHVAATAAACRGCCTSCWAWPHHATGVEMTQGAAQGW